MLGSFCRWEDPTLRPNSRPGRQQGRQGTCLTLLHQRNESSAFVLCWLSWADRALRSVQSCATQSHQFSGPRGCITLSIVERRARRGLAACEPAVRRSVRGNAYNHPSSHIGLLSPPTHVSTFQPRGMVSGTMELEKAGTPRQRRGSKRG